MSELFFHLAFVALFATFLGIRAYYHRLAARTAGRVEYREGKLHAGLRGALGVPWIGGVVAYMAQPGLLAWAQVPLPVWTRWVGVVLGLASLPLIWWVHRALGSNFSTTLHVRDAHTLATDGPYRWVRHPMYTVLYLHIVGLLLLTGNWLVGGVPLIALTVIVVTRLNNEEATMVEKFGDAYRTYATRTGRFLPRLNIWDLRTGGRLP